MRNTLALFLVCTLAACANNGQQLSVQNQTLAAAEQLAYEQAAAAEQAQKLAAQQAKQAAATKARNRAERIERAFEKSLKK